MIDTSSTTELRRRSEAAYRTHRQRIYHRTDRMFAGLLLMQWVGAVVWAMWASPRTWTGLTSGVHPHVYLAFLLGGLLCSLPVTFAWLRPGRPETRYSISIAQILFSSLLIHISGGRIETHFHIFGSLAFLAAYRDWKLLIPPTVIAAGDHLVRGWFWPESIYGMSGASQWRWVEHAAWVIFEDIFLVISIRQGVRDLKHMSEQSAERGLRQDRLEELVAARTEELVAAKVEAETANRAKSAFLANMSHEIRTPISAITGYAELLLEPDQTPADRTEALQTIRRSSRHLVDLINDILDISKIEADKMTVERIPVDLPQIAGDVISLMRPAAIAKGLAMQLSFDKQIPRIVPTDPVRLKQVLVNLIGNAVKFTEQGQVHLNVSSRMRDAECALVFEVKDTGIGMSREQIDRIFRPFTQADESTTRQFGGTGLGLTISKRLAELLGGSLSVDSLPGVGSRFRVIVPAGPVASLELLDGIREASLAQAELEPAPSRIALRARILLAEDGPENQKLISLHLRKAGAEVVVANNGRVAVELAEAEPFDLIVMDMQMPEMDGYAATRELRARGHTLPILALTAHAMADDRAKCLRAGCSDYLTKPVERRTLIETLARHLRPNADVPAEPVEAIQSSYADDPDMAELIVEFVGSLPERVSLLLRLLEERDLPELQRVLHQMKGAGGGYGFERITEVADLAGRDLKRGAEFSQVETEVQRLVEVARNVRGYDSSKETCHVG